MALQTSLNGLQRRGKKPARQHKATAKGQDKGQDKAQDKAQEAGIGTQSQWVEDTPFYLDAIKAFQATLTEEEKEALHLSLQE